MKTKTVKVMHRRSPEPQLRAYARSDGPGYIEGYLAVFGNIDQGQERIVKGAFAKSIAERVPTGRVPLMVRHFLHGGDVADVIGKIVEAREDDHGLWIRAELSKTQLAQETRTKIKEGIVWGLSVGFELMRWQEVFDEGMKSPTLELLECKLLEGTVTVKPMNEAAVILAAKDLRSAITAEDTSPSGDESRLAQIADKLAKSLDRFLDAIEAKSRLPESEDRVVDASEGWDAVEAKMRTSLAEQETFLLGLETD